MKNPFKIILTICGISALVFFGCKKKETVEVDNETQSAVDNAVADQEYAAIVPTTNNHAVKTKGTGANSGKSAVIACDTLTKISGDTLFGMPGHVDPTYKLSLGTLCPSSFFDGKIRSGDWYIRLTGKISTVGSKMIIKLVNHKANAITYSCDSMIVTTLASSTIAPAYTTFNIKLINGVCQSSAWVIKYSSDRTFTHYHNGNPSGTDPLTQVYGTANGINRQGRAFTVNIPQSSPLIKHRACQYIDKGILELIPDGFKARSIDFGDGTCNEDATFTVNGNTVAFKLK